MKKLLTAAACIFLLASCQDQHANNENAYAAADTTSIIGLSGDSVKLVKTASIQCKVKDVQQSTRTISAFTQQVGGLITHQSIETTEDGTKELKLSDDSLMVVTAFTTRAAITARVPAQNLEEFIYHVSDLGYLVSNSNMTIDDKSLQYLATHLKQQNRVQLLASTSNKGQKAPTTLQLLHKKDEVIDQEMQKRQIDADVQYSTVQLSLFQNPLVRKEVIANYVINDYHLSFSKNLSNAFSAGWTYFLSFILFLTHFWMFIISGITVWLIYKTYRSKRVALIKG